MTRREVEEIRRFDYNTFVIPPLYADETISSGGLHTWLRLKEGEQT
jgi:hypothetical protein